MFPSRKPKSPLGQAMIYFVNQRRTFAGVAMKLIRMACAVAFALAGSAHAEGVGLQHFSIVYIVRAGGIGVGETSYDFTFQGSAFQATSSRRSTGLARTLTGNRQDFDYAARGDIDDAGAHPRYYRHEDAHRHRVVEVTFAGDDVITTAHPPMGMGNPPATPVQKTGAIDQVSMFAQMLTVRGDPCRQHIKVFLDGRSRFDLTLTPNGRQSVSVPGFRGQAFRCAVQYAPIAGFSDPQQSAQLTFLLAPVNGYFVPVSVEMPTQDVGIVRLEARAFSIVGAR
jgi:hypothetical protein